MLQLIVTIYFIVKNILFSLNKNLTQCPVILINNTHVKESKKFGTEINRENPLIYNLKNIDFIS